MEQQVFHEILPASLAINSMRDSGYKDAAHALAELIDNSIQAGIATGPKTAVEVICLDQVKLIRDRNRARIDEIAIYDNASGMSPETLRMALQFGNGTNLDPLKQTSIGKFGMGLPNASISQCTRVDVWSWQNGKCFKTHLDLSEIKSGEMRDVPEPIEASIPEKWKSLIEADILDHGTLIVWSDLDRVRWKQGQTFLKNTEFIIGRTYRYFLEDKSVNLRLAAYETDESKKTRKKWDEKCRPNDPLYLMKGTALPVPHNNKPPFNSLPYDHKFTVKLNGEEQYVGLKFSIVRKDFREAEQGGGKLGSKHLAKNIGVSVVRAKRELEMNRDFDKGYDPTDRWWGCEVSFEPGLDRVFGVTNNKQAATAFKHMNLEADAAAEEMTPGEYTDMLRDENDIRLPMYEISKEIQKTIQTIRKQLESQFKGSRKSANRSNSPGSAESIATKVTERRKKELGEQGESDKGESLSQSEKVQEIQKEFEQQDIEPTQAGEMALEVANSPSKFVFRAGRVGQSAIFDVSSRAGKIFVTINEDHPAYDGLFELLDQDDESTSKPLKALKLLFEAWARLEDTAGPGRRQQLEDARGDWGRIARDFLQEASNY